MVWEVLCDGECERQRREMLKKTVEASVERRKQATVGTRKRAMTVEAAAELVVQKGRPKHERRQGTNCDAIGSEES